MKNISPVPLFIRSAFERRGTVLIVVIWVALGLVSLAVYFGNSMMVEYRAADNALASREADQAIEGARRYISQVLADSSEKGEAPDIGAYQSEKAAVGDAAFWLVGRSNDADNSSQEAAYSLVDEASKVNINTASLEMLQALPGMTPGLAAAIIDWRDVDSDLSPGGAESTNYLMLDPPYNCKNARFETTEELRLVLGMDLKTLYGEDANCNGVLDPNENDGATSAPDDNTDGKLDAGIMEYVTVFSREPNTRNNGSPRVNITGNQQEVWRYLGETLGPDRSAQVRVALGPNLQGIRSVLEFCARGGITPQEAARVEDGLTVSPQSFIEGRINVGMASTAVLACIPGIGTSLASKLVSARQGKSSEDLKTTAWVLGVLNPQAASQAGPYITSRSYQFSADVVALGHHGRGFRRSFFIFDTTGSSPIICYRRDLTRLGWPLGSSVRDEYKTVENS